MLGSKFVGGRFLIIQKYDLRDKARKDEFVAKSLEAQLPQTTTGSGPEMLAVRPRGRGRVLKHLGFVAIDEQFPHRTVCGYGVVSHRLYRSSDSRHIYLEGMRVAPAYRGDYVGAALMEAMVGSDCFSESPVIDPTDLVGRLEQRTHESDISLSDIPEQRLQNEPPGMTVLDVRRTITQAYPAMMQLSRAFRGD